MQANGAGDCGETPRWALASVLPPTLALMKVHSARHASEQGQVKVGLPLTILGANFARQAGGFFSMQMGEKQWVFVKSQARSRVQPPLPGRNSTK